MTVVSITMSGQTVYLTRYICFSKQAAAAYLLSDDLMCRLLSAHKELLHGSKHAVRACSNFVACHIVHVGPGLELSFHRCPDRSHHPGD